MQEVTRMLGNQEVFDPQEHNDPTSMLFLEIYMGWEKARNA